MAVEHAQHVVPPEQVSATIEAALAEGWTVRDVVPLWDETRCVLILLRREKPPRVAVTL